MEKLREWPPVLLRKWLLSIAIGLGYLAVGVVMFFVAGDHVLLVISLLLVLATALRCARLFRLFSSQGYEWIDGTCVGIRQAPLRKQRSLRLLDLDGAEHTFSLNCRLPVQVGRQYRVYFCPSSTVAPLLAQRQFLALEDLGELSAGTTKDLDGPDQTQR